MAAAAAAAGAAGGGGPIVLEEVLDEEYEPTQKEIEEYAEWIGLDLTLDRDLFWIAREGLKAPLPEHWKPCQSEDNEIFYFNFQTGESVWEHPADETYKTQYEREKIRKVVTCEFVAGDGLSNGFVRCSNLAGDDLGSFAVPIDEDPFGEWLWREISNATGLGKGRLRLVKSNGEIVSEASGRLTPIDTTVEKGKTTQQHKLNEASARGGAGAPRLRRAATMPVASAQSTQPADFRPGDGLCQEHSGRPPASSQLDAALLAKDVEIAKRDAALAEKDKRLHQRDSEVSALVSVIGRLETEMAALKDDFAKEQHMARAAQRSFGAPSVLEQQQLSQAPDRPGLEKSRGVSIVQLPGKQPRGTAAVLEDIDRTRAIFQRWDTANAGVIGREELAESLRNLGLAMAKDSIDELLEVARLNRDGSIRYDEFIDYVFLQSAPSAAPCAHSTAALRKTYQSGSAS